MLGFLAYLTETESLRLPSERELVANYMLALLALALGVALFITSAGMISAEVAGGDTLLSAGTAHVARTHLAN